MIITWRKRRKLSKMHLMYTVDENGTRKYTLKVRRRRLFEPNIVLLQKVDSNGKPTNSAHPGRQ